MKIWIKILENPYYPMNNSFNSTLKMVTSNCRKHKNVLCSLQMWHVILFIPNQLHSVVFKSQYEVTKCHVAKKTVSPFFTINFFQLLFYFIDYLSSWCPLNTNYTNTLNFLKQINNKKNVSIPPKYINFIKFTSLPMYYNI